MGEVLLAFLATVAVTAGAVGYLWHIAPKCYVVHAANAKEIEGEASKKWWLAALARDHKGHPIPMASKFLGVTDGDSMNAFGIPNGSRFVADKLTSNEKAALHRDQIVVVHGPSINSISGYRLRRIDRIEGGEAYFLADGKGHPHRPLPVDQVVARVSHVLESSTPESSVKVMAPA